MTGLLQTFLNKNIRKNNQIRESFNSYFFSFPEHDWIQGQIRENFLLLFSHLPVKFIEKIMRTTPIIFLKKEDLKTNLSSVSVVVVLPEYLKLLNTTRRAALAYIAHEFAISFLDKENLRADILESQIEADKFVSDLGLTFELEELLILLDEGIEKRLRLSYLTIKHFSNLSNQ